MVAFGKLESKLGKYNLKQIIGEVKLNLIVANKSKNCIHDVSPQLFCEIMEINFIILHIEFMQIVREVVFKFLFHIFWFD